MRSRITLVAALAVVAACGAFSAVPSPGGTADAGDAGAAGDACAEDPDPSRDCPTGLLRCIVGAACELDGLHDPNHCGSCDRACDDACLDGTCAPRHLDNHSETDPVKPDTRAVAADDTTATWIVNGEAFRVPDDGGGLGGQGIGVTGNPGEIEDLVVEGETAYFLTRSEIDSALIAGGGGGVLADVQAAIGGRLAFDASRVFFTSGELDGVVGFSDKTIKPGGAPRAPEILATGVHHPTDIFAVDGGVVFVAQADVEASNGAIVVALVAEKGTTRQKIRDLPRVGTMVATDGKEGIYSLVDRGEIWRFDTTTFTPARIASGLTSPEHLALDETYVYFTAPDGIWRMKRCAADEPAARTRITNTTHGTPTGLVVHGRWVYWSASGGLWRVTR